MRVLASNFDVSSTSMICLTAGKAFEYLDPDCLTSLRDQLRVACQWPIPGGNAQSTRENLKILESDSRSAP